MLRLKYFRCVLLLWACSITAVAGEPTEDPLPLRRVSIPEDRVPAEMERVRQGTLVQLSRQDFEARVNRARQAGESLRNPPRLIEAHYSASLGDAALIGGKGRWKVLNPNAGAAVLAMQPLNLALRNAKAGDRDAVLGDLDGKTLGLLAEAKGEQSVSFEWTARGASTPGAMRFDLRLPPSAVAVLELKLPADRVVAPQESFFLSGPFPAEDAIHRLWRIDFSGRSQVDLVIRKSQDQPPLVVLAQLRARQEIEPDVVRADFDFQLEVLHQGVREFLFECDPDLRPYEVDVRNLESWETRAPQAPGQPFTLVVRLREPSPQGSLPIQVRCWSPLSSDQNWRSPGMRVLQALPRGETLLLRIHPEVRLEHWQPGIFRLDGGKADSPPGPPERSKSDWQTIYLSLDGLHPKTTPARPSARIRTRSHIFRAKAMTWWQIDDSASTLTTQITYEVVQGQLFRLLTAIPAGWEAEQVEMTPAGSLRNWTVLQENGQTLLAVDLQRPLKPATNQPLASLPRLNIHLRQPHRPLVPSAKTTLPFPDVVPVGARIREGVLGISIAPQLQAKAIASVPAATTEEEGPWGKHVPDFLYPYHGLPATGSLTLQPGRTLVRARCTSEVTLTAQRSTIEMRLLLEPQMGSPDVIDLYLSAPTSRGEWNWKTEGGRNQVHRVQRLPLMEALSRLNLLGAVHPLDAAVRLAAPPARSEVWRVTLAQPLREPLLLHATRSFPSSGGPELRWEVPLPAVLGAETMEGEVVLHPEGVEETPLIARGVAEVPTSSTAPSAASSRTFQYRQAPAAFLLGGKKTVAGHIPANEPIVDHAALTTAMDPESRLLHHYRFQVRNWRQPMFPVRLPAGARCLAAKADDRWVTRLDIVASTEESAVVHLPIGSGDVPHLLEVVYETEPTPWKLWTIVDAPTPELPIRPLVFQRTWRLPSGIVPVMQEKFQRLPGPIRREGSEPLAERSANLSPSSLVRATLSPSRDSEDVERQRLLFTEACAAGLRKAKEGKIETFGELLDYIAFDHLQGKHVIVLDATAMRTDGLSPTTPLSFPSGGKEEEKGKPAVGVALNALCDNVGVRYLSCRGAHLLTSRKELESWRSADAKNIAVSTSIEKAVAEAAVHGHDRSGRFQSAAEWLQTQSPLAVSSNHEQQTGLWFDALNTGTNWTEWEPLPGVKEDDRLAVVRGDIVPLLGLTAAALLAVLAWKALRLPRGARCVLFLIWLAGGGLAMLWLPSSLHSLAWYPFLVGAGATLLIYLRHVTAPREGAELLQAAATILALAVLCAPLGWADPPQASDPSTVFILPGADNSPEKQTVLAAPELLKQLQALAARDPASQRRAVLIGAEYQGNLGASGADFEAHFLAYSFSDETVGLTLPLGGLQLKEATLDGAAAYPLALRPPLDGYTLDVKGRGVHKLILRFSVPLAGADDDRSIRFTIPEVVQSRLKLDAPAGTRSLYALGVRGQQTMTPELAPAAPADKPLHLEADLGRIGVLQARWHNDSRQPAAPTVHLREAYLWKLRPEASSLFAVLQFTMKQGATSVLTLDLPEPLEVRSVDTSRLPEAAPDDSFPRLKDWSVSGKENQRRLQFEFQRPIASGVQITLELVPRAPFEASAVLPLPTPQNVQAAESLLAYQVEGLRAQVAEHLRVNGMDPKAFLDSWKAMSTMDPGAEVRAYTFQRGPAGPPYLRLDLSLSPPDVNGIQKISWRIGPRQADLSAIFVVKSLARDLQMLELEVPESVKDVEITGPEVRYWTRDGSRIRLWLQHPVHSASLELRGWQLLDNPAKKKADPSKTSLAVFHLNPLGVVGIRSLTTHLRLAVAEGFTLAPDPEQIKNLQLSPDTRSSNGEYDYTAKQSDFAGIFYVQPAEAKIDLRVLTFAEVIDRNLTFRAVLDYHVRHGDVRTLTVKLRNWKGAEVSFEAPGTVQRREHPTDGGGRSWTMMIPEGIRGNYRLKLSGRMPLEAKTEILMPDVSAEGVSGMEQWVVVGEELQAEKPNHLTQVSDLDPLRRVWPTEAERIRRSESVWKVQANDWRLHLSSRASVLEADPLQLLLIERSARVVDGRRWIHQAVFRLYQGSSAGLLVSLPDGATLISQSIDGTTIGRPQADSESLWLPLPEPAGARTVRLSWCFPPEKESLDQPNLGPLHFQSVPSGPTLWTIHVPPGRRAESKEIRERVAGPGDLDLARADAMLRLSVLLGQRRRPVLGDPFTPQLVHAQELFYRYCRPAEHHLAQASLPFDRLTKLKDQNLSLAKTHGYEEIRAKAEQEARLYSAWPDETKAKLLRSWGDEENAGGLFSLPVDGTPLYLQTDPESQSLQLRLVSQETDEQKNALRLSIFFLLLLIAGSLFLFAPLKTWARFFWPEQMLLLGCLGWLLFGPSWSAVFLAVLGVSGRLIYLCSWTAMLFQRLARPAVAGGRGSFQ